MHRYESREIWILGQSQRDPSPLVARVKIQNFTARRAPIEAIPRSDVFYSDIASRYLNRPSLGSLMCFELAQRLPVF